MKRSDPIEVKRLYWVWVAMRQRCSNPTNKRYADYGGRGIRVCERWDSFENFCADMGERPTNTSLDRKNNDGHYCKENCHWATAIEQSGNRSYCIRVEIGNETVSLKEYCRRTGLNYKTTKKRVRVLGWSIKDAISITQKLKPWAHATGAFQ